MTGLELEAIQKKHQELLRQSSETIDVDIDISQVEDFLRILAQAGADIDDVEQRSLLRALIRYWASLLYDKTETFPIIQLQPFDESKSQSKPITGIEKPSTPASDITIKVRRTFRDRTGIWAVAYGASLLITGILAPVVASLIEVTLYLTLPNSPLPSVLGVLPSSPWYILVYSSLLTGLLWILAAVPFRYLSTAQGANARNYGLLRSRLHQLKASLGLKDYADGSYEEINSIETVMNHAGFNEQNKHQRDILKEAYACCIDISRKFYKFPAGLPWIMGTGYNDAWSLLHHAEEVMVEVQDVETVVRGAKHDFLAIEGSKMDGQDELLEDVIQAVSVIKPEAQIYFKEHQPSRSGVALSQLTQLINQPAASPDASRKKPGAHFLWTFLINQFSASSHAPGNNGIDPDVRAKAETAARGTLREVRSRLNDFRDQRWEGMVRQRGRLMMSIVVTGIITHALLCVIILTNPPPVLRLNLLAAALFYMIGAVAGLFIRFYSESQGGASLDDFGLSTTRLMAIPLLSGLAGVGGVFVLGGLAILGGPVLIQSSAAQSMSFSIARLFSLDPQFLLAAAIFGVTPNLLIKGLQQKANEYEADLKSSKATGTQAGSART